MPLLLSLRNRTFALLWSGQTVSRLGDSLYRIALAGWATDRIGAPAVFIIGGALTTALALSVLLHPAIRSMD